MYLPWAPLQQTGGSSQIMPLVQIRKSISWIIKVKLMYVSFMLTIKAKLDGRKALNVIILTSQKKIYPPVRHKYVCTGQV